MRSSLLSTSTLGLACSWKPLMGLGIGHGNASAITLGLTHLILPPHSPSLAISVDLAYSRSVGLSLRRRGDHGEYVASPYLREQLEKLRGTGMSLVS